MSANDTIHPPLSDRSDAERGVFALLTLIDREEIIAAFWGHPDLMPETWYSSLRARLAVLWRKTLTFGFVIVHAPLTGKWRCRWRMADPGTSRYRGAH